MRRRQVLATLGCTLLPIAGCSSPQQDAGDSTPTGQTGDRSAGGNTTTPTETATPTKTNTPTETATPTRTPDTGDLSVTVDALQPALVVVNTDWYEIHPGDDAERQDRQYLSLHLSTDSDDPPGRSDLTFRFDGTEFPPVDSELESIVPRALGAQDSRYSADDGDGWVIFGLPASGDQRDATLLWQTGTWTPDEKIQDRLVAPPPSLSLEWSVPETVTADTALTMAFTVTNDSDQDGRFVAGLNKTPTGRPFEASSRLIPAGQTITWTTTDENPFEMGAPEEIIGDQQADVTYDLTWTDEELEREVRLVADQ